MHASSGAGVSAMSRHLGQPPSTGMYNGTSAYPNGKSQTLVSTNSRKRRERPRPVGSPMLTDAENLHLFDMLGPERISLTAGVAQLLAAENNGISSRWTKWHVGVASLVSLTYLQFYLTFIINSDKRLQPKVLRNWYV